MNCPHCGMEVILEPDRLTHSHRRSVCTNANCGATWPWRQSTEDALRDVRPWVIHLDHFLRRTRVFYMGKRIRKIRRLEVLAPIDDAAVIRIEVLAIDGVTIEGAEGVALVNEGIRPIEGGE